jgi:hypothetical protein
MIVDKILEKLDIVPLGGNTPPPEDDPASYPDCDLVSPAVLPVLLRGCLRARADLLGKTFSHEMCVPSGTTVQTVGKLVTETTGRISQSREHGRFRSRTREVALARNRRVASWSLAGEPLGEVHLSWTAWLLTSRQSTIRRHGKSIGVLRLPWGGVPCGDLYGHFEFPTQPAIAFCLIKGLWRTRKRPDGSPIWNGLEHHGYWPIFDPQDAKRLGECDEKLRVLLLSIAVWCRGFYVHADAA